MSGSAVARLERVSFRALREASLEVPEGLTIVYGPNGSGKTSTALLLMGLAEPEAGRVEVLGRSPREAAGLGLVRGSLSPPRLDPALAPGETVGLHRGLCRGGAALGVDALLEGVPDRPVGLLSSGQRKRVDLARLFSCVPRGGLMVLDEPSENLDSRGRRLAAELVAKSLSHVRGVVVVTHDEGFAQLVARLAGSYHAVELSGGSFRGPITLEAPGEAGARGGGGSYVVEARALFRGGIPVSRFRSVKGVASVDYQVDVSWLAERLGIPLEGGLPLTVSPEAAARLSQAEGLPIINIDEVMVKLRIEAASVEAALEALAVIGREAAGVEWACVKQGS